MNFIELIRLKNHLEGLTITDIQQDADNRAKLVMHQADVPLAGIDAEFQQRLLAQGLNLQKSFLSFEHELQQLKNKVQHQIDVEGNTWLQQSYVLYEKQITDRASQRPEALELHRNKPVKLNTELETMLKARVGSYCSWQYPAMIIHPMLEPFIHEMVASDPLYVVDESHYLLEPTLNQFNNNYQQRLRTYIIEESIDWPILDRLPGQQFGFCLVYNYLNYRPFEIIKKYIEELYQKLLPGGILAMTFNDCDQYQAMQMVEQNITCYTPGSLIRGWAKYVGFEEIFCYHDESASVWIELKKPGTLSSLRGGQSLAKILPKPVA